MSIIIHFNTFYGKDAEETKLNLLDRLEIEFVVSSDAKQVFENPECESDGFDLYLKYNNCPTVDFDLLSSIAQECDLYVLVYDFEKKAKIGFWYDEHDKWINMEFTEPMMKEIKAII